MVALNDELMSAVCEDDLKQLVSAAEKCHINFVYALSPGLDVIYSSKSDVDAIKAKLNQV